MRRRKRARLGALDDAVVVGRGQRHRLGDAELADPFGRGVGPLGRVGDRAGGDDRALAAHQPRNRGDGADAAGVGEGDVGALEVVGGELALAGLGDQVLVVGVEAGEVELVGPLDRGDHQAVRAVLALDVDRDPEVDRPPLERERLPLPLFISADHHRPRLGGLNDRPSDQMSKGDLHPPLFKHPIERLALGIQRVNGNCPERSSRRNGPTLVHRLRKHPRRPPQRLRLTSSHGSCPPLRDRRPAIGRGQHILLGHLGAWSRATDCTKVDACRSGHSASHRRSPHIGSGPVGPASGCAALLRVARGRGRERSRCTARRPLPRARTRSRAI